jgi:hypothetical protein
MKKSHEVNTTPKRDKKGSKEVFTDFFIWKIWKNIRKWEEMMKKGQRMTKMAKVDEKPRK